MPLILWLKQLKYWAEEKSPKRKYPSSSIRIFYGLMSPWMMPYRSSCSKANKMHTVINSKWSTYIFYLYLTFIGFFSVWAAALNSLDWHIPSQSINARSPGSIIWVELWRGRTCWGLIGSVREFIFPFLLHSKGCFWALRLFLGS